MIFKKLIGLENGGYQEKGKTMKCKKKKKKVKHFHQVQKIKQNICAIFTVVFFSLALLNVNNFIVY